MLSKNFSLSSNDRPYDHVFVLGDSLASIKDPKIDITLTFDFWVYSFTEKIKRTIPDPDIYYTKRFSNGPNFYDYLKALMPELPFKDHYNFAYPATGSSHNITNFFVREKLNRELGGWKNWVSSTVINHHPNFDNQFQQVIDEKHRLAHKRQTGRSLVFVWGAGIHNDLIGLPYLAGYNNEWATLPNITETDVKRLASTLYYVIDKAGEKLKKNITRLYETGIQDIAFFDGLPIEKTPYFVNLKKKYINVKGFAHLINNMASTYNAALKSSIDDLKRTFIAKGKALNITYIASKDLTLSSDFKSVSFLDKDGMRHGKPFELKKTTPQERLVLDNSYFYDPNHLTTNGAWTVASFVADQLYQKEANIKRHNTLYSGQNQHQLSSPNLSVRPKDQYATVLSQKGKSTLGLNWS